MDRKQYIGGGDIAVILGISPFKKAYRLWQVKKGLVIADDISNLPHVKRGLENEPFAREFMNDEFALNFEEKFFQDDDHDFFGGSLDGYDEETKTFIEIKCMGKENHQKAKNNELPEYYNTQIQWYYMVSNAINAYFVSCYPETGEVVYFPVERDDKLISKMRKEALKFWTNNILGDKPPEDGKPNKFAEDETVMELSQKYKELKLNERMIQDEMKMIKSRLSDYGELENSHIKLIKVKGGERINYSKFIKENHADLSIPDKYRSKTKPIYKISIR